MTLLDTENVPSPCGGLSKKERQELPLKQLGNLILGEEKLSSQSKYALIVTLFSAFVFLYPRSETSGFLCSRADESPTTSTKRIRCDVCRKRLGLTGEELKEVTLQASAAVAVVSSVGSTATRASTSAPSTSKALKESSCAAATPSSLLKRSKNFDLSVGLQE